MEQGIKQTHAESCARHISGSHAKPLGAIPAVSWPVAGLCSPSRAWGRDSGEGSGEPLGPGGGWAPAPRAGPGLGEQPMGMMHQGLLQPNGTGCHGCL